MTITIDDVLCAMVPHVIFFKWKYDKGFLKAVERSILIVGICSYVKYLFFFLKFAY